MPATRMHFNNPTSARATAGEVVVHVQLGAPLWQLALWIVRTLCAGATAITSLRIPTSGSRTMSCRRRESVIDVVFFQIYGG